MYIIIQPIRYDDDGDMDYVWMENHNQRKDLPPIRPNVAMDFNTTIVEVMQPTVKERKQKTIIKTRNSCKALKKLTGGGK